MISLTGTDICFPPFPRCNCKCDVIIPARYRLGIRLTGQRFTCHASRPFFNTIAVRLIHHRSFETLFNMLSLRFESSINKMEITAIIDRRRGRIFRWILSRIVHRCLCIFMDHDRSTYSINIQSVQVCSMHGPSVINRY